MTRPDDRGSPSPQRIHAGDAKRAARTIRCALLLLPVALVTLITGCRVAQGVADLPGQAVRAVSPRQEKLEAVDYAALQTSLMRFGDEFSANLTLAIIGPEMDGQPLSPRERTAWKLAYTTEIWGIVTQPNALSSLLDMTVFVTSIRIAMENHWVPNVFGDSGQPMLEACRRAETNIWLIAEGVLEPGERQELRAAIQEWNAQNQNPRAIPFLRSGNLFASVAASRTRPGREGARGSILGLVNLDPLAGLDPATRELTEARLFAERAAYVLQRLPWAVRWQAELLTYDTVDLPEVQQLVTNATSFAESAGRLSRTAEQLPRHLQEERRILLETLETQSSSLTGLAEEIHLALTAGSQMASNVNTALITFNTVADKLGLDQPPAESSQPSEPFRIADYTEAALRMDALAERLTDLLITFDQTLASTNLSKVPDQADRVLQQASEGGQALVDYAVRRALLLVLAVCLLGVTSILLVRRLAARSIAHPPSQHPPQAG